MEIKPISMVSIPKNNPVLSTGNDKHKHSSNIRGISNLKAVPLAVLIAMSPLTKVNAQGNTPDPEKMSCIYKSEVRDPAGLDRDTELMFMDTDNNKETVERAIMHIKNSYKAPSHLKNDKNEKIVYKNSIETWQFIDTVKQVNLTTKVLDDNGKTTKISKTTEYYVVGPRKEKFISTRLDNNTVEKMKNRFINNGENLEMEIDKLYYDSFKEAGFPSKVENKQIVEKESDNDAEILKMIYDYMSD